MCGKSTTKALKRYFWKYGTTTTTPRMTSAKWKTISEIDLQPYFVNRNILMENNGEKSHEICPRCFKHETEKDNK